MKVPNPKIFEEAIRYLAEDIGDFFGRPESSRACCASIGRVVTREYSPRYSQFYKDESREYFFGMFYSEREAESSYWWGYDITPKNYTARVIALQLAALVARDERSKPRRKRR